MSNYALKLPDPGYDVYEGEWPVKFEQMAPVPLRAILRGSAAFMDGYRREDIHAWAYAVQLRQLLIRFGLYHFLRPNHIAEQAQLFIKVLTKIGYDMPPIVDVEVDPGLNNVGHQQWADQVKVFLDLIEQATGHRPIIYTNRFYWGYLLVNGVPPAWTEDYALWLAWYPYYPDDWTAPPASVMPKGWTRWAIWQYAEHGRSEGFLANDLNIFSDWFKAELAIFRSVPPTQTGGSMFNYEATSNYRMSLREDHTTYAATQETLAAGAKMRGNEIWTAQADGDQVMAGDQWLHVLDVNGQPKDGWVAIVHKRTRYCTLTQLQPAPDPTPTPSTKVPFTLAVQGYKPYSGELEQA